jgi:hypothetical protein
MASSNYQREYKLNSHSELVNGLLSVYVKVSEKAAHRGGAKWVRFWVYDWLLVQGTIYLPQSLSIGNAFEVNKDQFWDDFTVKRTRYVQDPIEFQSLGLGYKGEKFTDLNRRYGINYELPKEKIIINLTGN